MNDDDCFDNDPEPQELPLLSISPPEPCCICSKPGCTNESGKWYGVPGRDYDPEEPMCQDDYEFFSRTGQYRHLAEDTTRQEQRPIFHEHEQNPAIPIGYGIDESHDGGFYPYQMKDIPIYFLDESGYDARFLSFDQALKALHKRCPAGFSSEQSIHRSV